MWGSTSCPPIWPDTVLELLDGRSSHKTTWGTACSVMPPSPDGDGAFAPQAERGSGDTHPPPLNTTWEWPSPGLAPAARLTQDASRSSSGITVSYRAGEVSPLRSQPGKPRAPPCAAAVLAEGSLRHETRSNGRTVTRAVTPFPRPLPPKSGHGTQRPVLFPYLDLHAERALLFRWISGSSAPKCL